MLNAINGSIQNELSRFFQVLDEAPVSLVNISTAAFCKARMKFSYSAFKALNRSLTETFYQSSSVRLWNGFRLLAVDASVTQLPNSPALLAHYGKARSHSLQPAARMSQLYDVLNKLTVDLEVDSHATGERNMALKHLDSAREKDLLLYDRGYPAVWFFKYHQLNNVDFCARATLDSSNIVTAFVLSGKSSEIAEFPCIEKSLRRCRKDGLSTNPIKLRLIRVNLPSGTTEVLLTSLLDEDTYPHSLFADLYHQRWSIEEDYKVMKSRLTIENFSGFSVEAVLQDIHAKTLTKNLAAVAIVEADRLSSQVERKRKHHYKLNISHALNQLKDNIVRFLMGTAVKGLSELLIAKISRVANAYRPERKFNRPWRRMSAYKYPTAYKRSC